MASAIDSVEEESQDLSHCCICMEEFDNGLHKPKYLSCYHTLCLQCIKTMIQEGAGVATTVTCPVCKVICPVSGGAERLSTNICWCLVCDANPKLTCRESSHTIVEILNVVKGLRSLLTETSSKVSNYLNEAVAKREQAHEHIQVLWAQNSSCLQNLHSKINNNKFSANSESVVDFISLKETLDNTVKEAKEEVEEANQMLSKVVGTTDGISTSGAAPELVQVDSTQNVIRSTRAAGDEGDGTQSNGLTRRVGRNGFSTERLGLPHSMHNRDLAGHSAVVRSIEFSNDGSLLVSGGNDDRVLIWNIDQVFDMTRAQTPTSLKVPKMNLALFSLAFSPDNSRIIIGSGNHVFIHDTNTTGMLDSVPHLASEVIGMALQPGSNIGEVFATGSSDGVLRLFDIRLSKKIPAIAMTKRRDTVSSVMFSPTEPTLVAASGLADGTQLYDIRFPNQSLYSFQSNVGVGAKSARFDTKGTRLLCSEADRPLVFYDLPTANPHLIAAFGKTSFSAEGYKIQMGAPSRVMKSPCCFAGEGDELVVGASDDNKIYIWPTTPKSHFGHRASQVNAPLLVLGGHRDIIRSVRYSVRNGILASCGERGVVKLWSIDAF